jgi:hypothetical protein
MKAILLTSASVLVTVSIALAAVNARATQHDDEKHTTTVHPYVPGLGDVMSGVQRHHAKLWFAGENANWPLAQYEFDELGESFDDAQTFAPTFKDIPIPVAQSIQLYVVPPKTALEKAIAHKDKAAFAQAYDALSAACNACHQTYKHEFIQIVRPTAPPVTNQSFAPH